MAYDPDTSAYWCEECSKHMTVAFGECTEDVLVLKCQGNMLNRKAGCGATRRFQKTCSELHIHCGFCGESFS